MCMPLKWSELISLIRSYKHDRTMTHFLCVNALLEHAFIQLITYSVSKDCIHIPCVRLVVWLFFYCIWIEIARNKLVSRQTHAARVIQHNMINIRSTFEYLSGCRLTISHWMQDNTHKPLIDINECSTKHTILFNASYSSNVKGQSGTFNSTRIIQSDSIQSDSIVVTESIFFLRWETIFVSVL